MTTTAFPSRAAWIAVFLAVLALPLFYFIVILVQFKWNFEQTDLGNKHFIFEGASYANSNPYYHFSAHMISGFYLLIIPIQSILVYGLNTQLDYKNNGRMLIRSLKFSQWKRRACGFTVSSLLIMLSWVITLYLLIICLNTQKSRAFIDHDDVPILIKNLHPLRNISTSYSNL